MLAMWHRRARVRQTVCMRTTQEDKAGTAKRLQQAQTANSHLQEKDGVRASTCGKTNMKKITGYELECTKHMQEQWMTQGTHDEGGTLHVKMD